MDYPFQKWGLDIIGEINSNSSQLQKYILMTTYYFTCWMEAIPLKVKIKIQVISFLNSHIVTRFGIPQYLVFENENHFPSLKLTEYALENNIKMKYASNYYPGGNGLVESMNKKLITIIKKIVTDDQRSLHLKLPNTLWAIIITPKSSLGNSPFFLVYDQ